MNVRIKKNMPEQKCIEAINFAIATCCLVLHDEFDFGHKRLQRLLSNMGDILTEHKLGISEVYGRLSEECKIKMV